MVGITTIANDNAPQDRKISLFYNLANKHLALEQRSERTQRGDPVSTFVSHGDAHEGIIVNPSEVAATNFNGLPFVFGFTTPNPVSVDCLTKHHVSVISPVYIPLTMTLKSNIKITAASNGTSTSVFYLIGGGGNPIQIEQHNMNEHIQTVLEDATGILEGSSLAAYWAEDRGGPACRIIYQAKHENALYDYKPEDGSQTIQNTDARTGSPLAVTVANNRVYLYYVSTHNKLMKTVKSDINKPDSWGSSTHIKTSKVHPDSQITVVAAGGQNHIFFASSVDIKVFEHVTDAW